MDLIEKFDALKAHAIAELEALAERLRGIFEGDSHAQERITAVVGDAKGGIEAKHAELTTPVSEEQAQATADADKPVDPAPAEEAKPADEPQNGTEPDAAAEKLAAASQGMPPTDHAA